MDDGPPYPPRTNGYVDCLTSAQHRAFNELCRQLPSSLDGLANEHLTLWGVQLADLAADAHQQAQPPEAPQQHQQQGQEPKQQQEQQEQQQQQDDASRDLRAFCTRGPSRVQKVVLLKFLRARQFNVPAALTMLVNCLKWRRDFDVAGLSLENFPPQLGQAGQLSGRDRARNPVTYNYYGTDLDLFGSPGGVATFVRWRVKLMEQAVGLLDFEAGIEHVTQVHDYSGASMFRMDSNIKAASRQIIKLFQDNYPEMLSAKLFLNVPRVMEFIFGIFSAFSDAATRAKFVMASPARARSVLLQYIDTVQLPERFGGCHETCSVPPIRGRSTSFSAATSKKVILKPGESHVTSKLVGSDSEVVWCFCTTGPEIGVSIRFRPGDKGEAAAAAARHPDHMPGVAHPSSRHRDAQHLNETHHMALAKDAGSGRLVLGCPGEVVMTIDHNRAAAGGFFTTAQPVTVHYALITNAEPPPPLGPGGPLTAAAGAAGGRGGGGPTSGLNPHASLGPSSECGDAATASGRLFEGGGGGGPHPLDWRSRVLSYKSLGCSSFNSNDLGPAEPGATGGLDSGQQPESPSGRGGGGVSGPLAALTPPPLPDASGGTGAGAGGGCGGVTPVAISRFETVPEVEESGTVSPAPSTRQEGSELRSP